MTEPIDNALAMCYVPAVMQTVALSARVPTETHRQFHDLAKKRGLTGAVVVADLADAWRRHAGRRLSSPQGSDVDLLPNCEHSPEEGSNPASDGNAENRPNGANMAGTSHNGNYVNRRNVSKSQSGRAGGHASLFQVRNPYAPWL